MDYYSGQPEIETDEIPDESLGIWGMMKKYSFIVLIVLAIVIVILTVIFFSTGGGAAPKYNTLDRDSFLSSLEVSGGQLEPEFDSKVFNYTIRANEKILSFTCKTSSDKAKIDGCKKTVRTNLGSYEIAVTAEDGNVTRYRFEIIDETDNNLE